MKGCESAALRADAWLALVDRFQAPLLPLRPYGVVVYDMIQKHIPEAFQLLFYQWVAVGMRPTLKHADMVLVTSPATRDDVLDEYQLASSRLRLIPVACEPQRRFASLEPHRVPLPREPFILNVTNAAPHKGAAVLLRAHAKLKEQKGQDTPLLVMCGRMTHTFSPRFRGQNVHPDFVKVRHLVSTLGLEENRDVVFLGFVTDSQLMDLYQRCSLVVNSAKYDNGSFSLIEATYFGRPAVSSRYQAAQYLCERFGIPAEFFTVDDDAALAQAMDRALAKRPALGDQLAEMRLGLAVPELSSLRYAERIYECLVQLAALGRKEKLKHSSANIAA
jgi:glycosyltransferase involved in cell wall biosynthesis